jgi:hypothetical protein
MATMTTTDSQRTATTNSLTYLTGQRMGMVMDGYEDEDTRMGTRLETRAQVCFFLHFLAHLYTHT